MLDLSTFLLIIGIGNLSFAGLMAVYARGPIAQPALGTWMWARVILGICQVTSCVNLYLESTWLGLVCAMGWFVGMTWELGAYCLFFSFANWRRNLYSAVALSFGVVAVAQASGATVFQLVPVIAAIVSLFAGAMGFILMWPRACAPGLQRIIGTNDALLAVSLLAWVWSDLRQDGAHAPGGVAIQTLAFIAGYIAMIVKGFGFLLLCKQEDDRKMLHLATVDSLTGMLNRHAFFAQAQTLRARAGSVEPVAVMMLDLDHFKRINDRFGHATGDAALRLFAATAQAVLAGRGVLGRLGGEEFALALPAPLDEALDVAEQLRAAITAALLPTGGEPYMVTVSVGVAVLTANEELDAGLVRADQALYDAKRSGRNRVEPGRLLVHGVDPGPTRLSHGDVDARTEVQAPNVRVRFYA